MMDFHLEPVEDSSRVFVDTDLKLSGTIAQYGRAAGIVEQLADQIVAEFAKNLRMKLDKTRSDASDQTVGESPERQPVKPISAIGLLFKVLSGMLTRWTRAILRRS